LNSDQIAQWIDQMEKETKEIRQEAIKMAWYMRGGLTYEQAMSLSATERKIIGELIKDNLETTKKSGLPFF
jgi:predicted RNA-binding protein Jag